MTIEHVPPRFWNDIIYKHNGESFNNEILHIKCNGKHDGLIDRRHYHTNKNKGGHCPKPFISHLFGDQSNATIVLNCEDYEIDVCNCYISYKPHPKGTLQFKSNVVYRYKLRTDWNSRMINTTDTLL